MRWPRLLLLAVAAVAGATVSVAQSPAAGPPCAPPQVADPMPEGGSHDHTDPAQHRYACDLDAVATLDLRREVPEPMLFGEVDLAGTIAVVATTFPDGGFVTLDISTPTAPVVLSRFRGPKCETETDLDCGADIKLSPDGKTAFLAVQRSARTTRAESARTQPGIAVVDLSDPRVPVQRSFFPLPPVGVHALVYHPVGQTGYLWARVRGLGDNKRSPGVAILRMNPNRTLTRVGDIATDAAHDMFLFDDPVDATTYLYIAGAQSGSLFIYDVGDPAKPKRVGEWRPPPEIANNEWYVHNAWTFREGNRRLTFVGVELYNAFGTLPAGHGGAVGPVWLLDTTNHARPVLAGEWRNPGRHKAGNLVFSPHNTWYAGDGITWTSHYHGGVWVLDWSAVFRGETRRPREIGYHVSHEINRPFVQSDAKEKFITTPELLVRPLIWDVAVQGRFGFSSDINGGFIVLERPQPPSPAASPSGSASARPRSAAPGRAFPVALAVGLAAGIAVTTALVRRRPRS